MAHRRRRAREALRERQEEARLAGERRRRKAKRAGIALSVVVAIAVVLYLQRHPLAAPGDVKQALLSSATPGMVANAGRSPNLLVHLVD